MDQQGNEINKFYFVDSSSMLLHGHQILFFHVGWLLTKACPCTSNPHTAQKFVTPTQSCRPATGEARRVFFRLLFVYHLSDTAVLTWLFTQACTWTSIHPLTPNQSHIHKDTMIQIMHTTTQGWLFTGQNKLIGNVLFNVSSCTLPSMGSTCSWFYVGYCYIIWQHCNIPM